MSFYSYNVFPMGDGWIGLLGSRKGLRRLSFQPTPGEALEHLEPELADAVEDPASFPDARSCLERYFKGDVQALDSINLDMTDVPDFYRAAWTACREIPPGETRSYTWLAEAAGNPRAARAAGQAMAKNRYALIIPCHRVIASNGDLRGYGAGGLGVKARLLRMEQTGKGLSPVRWEGGGC